MIDLVETSREWLQNQPGMQPWSQGQSRILAHIGQWIAQYGAMACGRVPAAEEPLRSEAATRLWRCWEYHWRQAAELNGGKADGFEVADRLVAGLGFKGGGRLGGNPLEDVVLAVSVLHQEHVAVERFKERFRSDAVHYGRRHPLVQEDEEDWWCQLLVRLMGLDDQPGKLRRYSGRSGLKNWLARVAMNFPGCFVVPKGGANDGLEEIARSAPIPGPDDIECQELLGDAVRDAIGQLTPQQRALLYMLFAEGLAGKDVARILGIHPGQVSRRKEMAIEQLHAILGKLADASSRGGAYRDCLESLTGTRNWRELADVFLRTLRDLRPIDGDTPNEEADA